LRALNLAARFGLELCLLAALAVWGFSLDSSLAKVVAGLGAPLAAAIVWGFFVSPKAPRRLQDPGRLVLELVLFAAGTAALAATGHAVLAVAFAAAVIANEALLFVWDQRAA
jgi:uncharacterized protein DUF2568